MSAHHSERLTTWEEAPVYLPYEDGIRNRERRALRGPSVQERRNAARAAQAQSGQRVHIARAVLNQPDFREELKVWIPWVQDGVATRRSLGNLTMTLFNTSQQPLRYAEDYTEEDLRDKFANRYPALFDRTPPLEVTGTDLFGNENRPFIGLMLAPGFAYRELAEVRGIIAPELVLDSSHQNPHRPHVSLGQAFTNAAALELQKRLNPVLPAYVQFGPADINVENTTQ